MKVCGRLSGRAWGLAAVAAFGLSGCLEEPSEPPAGVADVTDVTDPGAPSDLVAVGDPIPGTDLPVDEVEAAAPALSAGPEPWATGGFAPDHVHVTWRHDAATTAVIQWRTSGALPYHARVWFARADETRQTPAGVELPVSPEHLALFGWGEVVSETAGDMREWTVELADLQPGAQYVYRAGTWDGIDGAGLQAARLSPAKTFWTAPAAGPTATAEFGLSGGEDGDTRSWDCVHATPDARFWVQANTVAGPVGLPAWDEWFGMLRPWYDAHVTMAVRGEDDVQLFYSQFALPRTTAFPDTTASWGWSVDYGPVHLVGVDLQGGGEPAVLQWLYDDLADAATRKDVPWKVVVAHRIPDPLADGSSDGDWSWHGILEHWGVDLVFAGHGGGYARSYPLVAGALAEPRKGVVYVTGADPKDDTDNRLAVHEDRWGVHLRVTADATHLSVSAHGCPEDEIVEQFSLAH